MGFYKKKNWGIRIVFKPLGLKGQSDICFLYQMLILFPAAAACSGKVEFGGEEEEAVVAGGGGGGGGGTFGGGGPAVPPSPRSDGGGSGSDTDAGDIQGDNVVLEDEVVKYNMQAYA